MTTHRLRDIALTGLAVGGLVIGCSAKTDRPATVPVSGTVTYRGKPVEGATVGFLAPGVPSPAYGTTDADGNFRLTTFEPDDGAIVGRHVVTVRKLAIGAAPITSAPPVAEGESVDPGAIDDAMQQMAQDVAKARRSGSLLPEKYSRRETSGLTIDVVDGDNVVKLDLKD